VIILDHLTDAQKRAYIIADNQLALNAGWDEELLRSELAALEEEDFNVNLIGFDDEELARLLAAQDAAEGLTDEDAVPELPQTPVSATGDLWILGSHQLLVGDATDGAAVARLMTGEAADLVFTDPPYNVDYQGYTEDHLKITRPHVRCGLQAVLGGRVSLVSELGQARRLDVCVPLVILATRISECAGGGRLQGWVGGVLACVTQDAIVYDVVPKLTAVWAVNVPEPYVLLRRAACAEIAFNRFCCAGRFWAFRESSQYRPVS
jgi:hypothetical protein